MSSPLAKVRSLLKQRGIKYLVVPSSDAHGSEYLAPQDKRRAFVSGFDGSAGTALVGLSSGDCYLWTDGRYWIQAEKQLDSTEWILMKAGQPGVPTIQEKLAKQLLQAGDKLGLDPRMVSISELRSYQNIIKDTGAELVWCSGLVDEVWEGRLDQVKPQSLTLMMDSVSGRSVSSKLESISSHLLEKKANSMVLSTLDEIAWLLNLRGADIPFNPVFHSFLIIQQKSQASMDLQVTLFIDKNKLNNVSDHIKAHNITVEEYDAFYQHLPKLSGTVMLDAAKCNSWIYTNLLSNDQINIIEETSIIAHMKSVKNDVELEGMREAHIEDGIALVEFFSWLEATVSAPEYSKSPMNEYQLAEKELTFRNSRNGFVGPSFETISSVGPNAAVIHYSPSPAGSLDYLPENIYLNDSGGQYLNGTTDVTRTWHFGNPTEEEIDANTRVLLGFIGLSRSRFPEGVPGFALDVLARNALWQAGMDYQHGTGHGVGHYLNVHEAPPYIGIYRGQDVSKLALKAGMVTSIEPGYYCSGKFGIRIENLAIVVKSGKYEKFLEFEQLTMAPISKKLINKSMLSEEDIKWLNNYHATVWEKVSPRLSDSAKEWLKKQTEPL